MVVGVGKAAVENIGLREAKGGVLQRSWARFGLGRGVYLGRDAEVEEIGEKSED